MSARNPNRASTVYLGNDGDWHGRVTMGFRDNGAPDRRHVRGKTKSEVVKKVRALERLRNEGAVQRAGQRWTIESWLEHWLENIARAGLRATSYDAYRTAVRKHLIPNVGKHRLDRLQPEHLELLYRKMISAGARPATAHQVHRTIRTALGEALRRGYVSRNVATIAKPPRVEVEPVEPYTLEEIRAILTTAQQGRNAARWAIALALGLRQGEVLGLKWADVDLDQSLLRIRSTRTRPRYEHGCGGDCDRAPGWCPQRRLINGETMLAAGSSAFHLCWFNYWQNTKCTVARARRGEAGLAQGDWVFTSPTGRPLVPNSDYHRWKALLKAARVRDARCMTLVILPPLCS
jgi:integrase